jgi:hypothetical protein
MTDYDFSTLNDKEFEVLCADVLGAREGKRFERFKPGKDAGVDGRFFAADAKEVVLQCKHWPSSPLERLVRRLKNDELQKIDKLNPSRYLLAVSHALSRNDKAAILQALSPHIRTPEDIFGREDLNDLLSKHSSLERRHYKLWIRSTAVLQYLLQKPIHDRSAFALEEILADAKLYAPTANHGQSLEKLERLGSVIITGAPGIGKTTLANHLILHYIEKGFQLLQIVDEIREAEAAFEPDEKQIFYFDDFLGRNYLEALTGHEGSHIVQFLKRISRDRTKRFILTSRTTILNQGKALIDVFTQNNLDKSEFEITIASLSELDKAHILYNHIWHSELEDVYVEELYSEKRYRQVVAHRNFNPRLIRFITDANTLADCEAKDYWARVQGLLANPAKVWEHPFEAQLDDFGRALVLLVALNGGAISQSDLSEAFARMLARPESVGYAGRRDFLLTLRHLAGSLLSRSVTRLMRRELPTIDLFNPSVGDFVLRRFATDTPTLRAAFCSLRSSTSVRTLLALVSSGALVRESAVSVLDALLINAGKLDFIGFASEHLSSACLARIETGAASAKSNHALAGCARFVAASDCPLSFGEVAKLVRWALTHGIITSEVAESFVAAAYKRSPHADELKALTEITRLLESESRDRLEDAHNDAALEYLTESVHDEIDDSDVFYGIAPDSLNLAHDQLRGLIESKLDDLGARASDDAIDAVIDAYDVAARAERFFADQDPNEDWREHGPSTPTVDEIDDLFDRN